MAARCDLTEKRLQVGNQVSHSQIKTKKAFKVNLQKVTLKSDVLDQKFSFRIAVSTLRTIDHNGGLDNFLTSTSNRKLSDEAIKLKKKIVKALEANANPEAAEKKAKTEEANQEAA
jgi:large subunit ribosomal protein L28